MNISSSTRLTIIIVFAIYTVFLIGYSIYQKYSEKKTAVDSFVNNFYTGGRGMGVLLTTFMISAGVAGAGIFIGVPGYIYKMGSVWLVCCFWSMSMNFMVLGQIGKKTGIVARRINAQSFVSMLMHRYNNNKIFGLLASVVVLLFLGGFAVSTAVGGARIFELLAGEYWVGLLIFMALVVLAAFTGGIKGVAGAILIQGIVMTVSVFILFMMGRNAAGPYTEVIRNLAVTIPEWFEPRWGNLSVAMSIGMVFSFAFLWGFTTFTLPHVAMTGLTYKNTRVMHRAIKVGLVVCFIWLCCINLLAFPIKALFPNLEVPDYGLLYLAVTALPPWVAGLILAGICAAVQSSLGGMIVALSSCLVKDFYQTIFKPNASEKTLKKLSLASTLLISAIIFIFALDPPPMLGVLITYSTGGLTAAFTQTLLLGYYWKGANEYGAIAGLVSGISLYLLIDKGLLPFSLGMNPVIMSVLISTIIMVIVCKLTPKSPYHVTSVWFGKTFYTLDANKAIYYTNENGKQFDVSNGIISDEVISNSQVS